MNIFNDRGILTTAKCFTTNIKDRGILTTAAKGSKTKYLRTEGF